MIDQIQTILRKEDISASQLAEKIGVQRSSISHILSERNKPSLDFITKLLEAFPHINSEWIITGKGSYRKETEIKKPITAPSISTPINLFNPPIEIKPEVKKETPIPETIKANSPISEPKTNSKKKTVKVITFYDDNTFDEYLPS